MEEARVIFDLINKKCIITGSCTFVKDEYANALKLFKDFINYNATTPSADDKVDNIPTAVSMPSESQTNDTINEKIKHERKSRTQQTPMMLANIDVVKNGSNSFGEFLENYKCANNQHKLMLTMYYLKEKKTITEISADHIYTVYKIMGWKIPNNIPQIFLNVKQRMKAVMNGTKKGSYKLSIQGDNIIEHELKLK